MNTLVLPRVLDEAQAEALGGTLLDDDSYDHLVTTTTKVVDQATGATVGALIKGAIPLDLCQRAYTNLRDAATVSDNRGIAAGEMEDTTKQVGTHTVGAKSRVRFRALKKDGTVSTYQRAKPVRSGIVGYFDRNPRYPYCRLTAYNLNEPDRFAQAVPFIQAVDQVFKQYAPNRYAAQEAIVAETAPDFVIKGTVFTTLTVNRNWQTAVHTDKGDYKPGLGVLACFNAGAYTGGHFVLPAWRVAFDMQTTDVLLADVHQWHGNSPIRPTGVYERLSLVFYYREGMFRCGTATEELERAKNRQEGDPVK